MLNYLKISTILMMFISALLLGCTKDEITPVPPSNEPVFSASGEIDGRSMDLEAGENNTYMHTGVVEINGVDQYRGALAKGNDKIQINISDGILDIPEVSTDIMSAGNIAIAPNHNGDVLAILSEELFSNSSYIEDISWTIDGEHKSEETVYITQPGKYEICADVVFYNGTTGSTCNTMLIGYQKNVSPVLKYIVGQSDQIIGLVEAPNSEISEIKWFKNDVLVNSSMTYIDSSSNSQSYALKARIEFENGSVREREIWVNRSNTNLKIADLSGIENQTNLQWDNKAIIEVNLDGNQYVSSPSTNDHKITIDNAWDYGTNDDGDKVTYIEGSIFSTFMNLNSGEIVEGTFSIRFGLAH